MPKITFMGAGSTVFVRNIIGDRRNRDKIYQAAFMDPHTSGELALDQIRALCDNLIKVHGNYLPAYK